MWVWFLVYSVVPIVLARPRRRRSSGASARDRPRTSPSTSVDQEGLIIAGGIVSVLAAIAWALLVRELTRRHTQLTGEATRR